MIGVFIAILLALIVGFLPFYVMFIFPWPFWEREEFYSGGPWG